MRAPGWNWGGPALALASVPLGCVLERPLALPTAPAPSAQEPPVPSECALYRGGAKGNDPTMKLALVLCPAPGGFVGWARHVSPVSGWSHREVTGAAAPDGTLVLRDSRMVESHATYGWELCLVEQYNLREVSPGVVEGTYASSACQDQSVVALKRVR